MGSLNTGEILKFASPRGSNNLPEGFVPVDTSRLALPASSGTARIEYRAWHNPRTNELIISGSAIEQPLGGSGLAGGKPPIEDAGIFFDSARQLQGPNAGAFIGDKPVAVQQTETLVRNLTNPLSIDFPNAKVSFSGADSVGLAFAVSSSNLRKDPDTASTIDATITFNSWRGRWTADGSVDTGVIDVRTPNPANQDPDAVNLLKFQPGGIVLRADTGNALLVGAVVDVTSQLVIDGAAGFLGKFADLASEGVAYVAKKIIDWGKDASKSPLTDFITNTAIGLVDDPNRAADKLGWLGNLPPADTIRATAENLSQGQFNILNGRSPSGYAINSSNYENIGSPVIIGSGTTAITRQSTVQVTSYIDAATGAVMEARLGGKLEDGVFSAYPSSSNVSGMDRAGRYVITGQAALSAAQQFITDPGDSARPATSLADMFSSVAPGQDFTLSIQRTTGEIKNPSTGVIETRSYEALEFKNTQGDIARIVDQPSGGKSLTFNVQQRLPSATSSGQTGFTLILELDRNGASTGKFQLFNSRDEDITDLWETLDFFVGQNDLNLDSDFYKTADFSFSDTGFLTKVSSSPASIEIDGRIYAPNADGDYAISLGDNQFDIYDRQSGIRYLQANGTRVPIGSNDAIFQYDTGEAFVGAKYIPTITRQISGDLQADVASYSNGQGYANVVDSDDNVLSSYTFTRVNAAGIGAIDGERGTISGTVNGQTAVFAADFGYEEDQGTTASLTGLRRINNQTPANAPIINAAIAAGNFDLRDILGDGDFSNGDLSGSVINGDLAQIIAAADPTNASGTPPLPATSTPAPTPSSPSWAAWVNSEEGKRFYAALTNTQNLLAAAQGGNPVPLVQDIFNFADSALQETNPILASQFGGAANGLGTVNSFRSLARAIERGDPVEIARSGAPVASFIISTYQSSILNQLSQMGYGSIDAARVGIDELDGADETLTELVGQLDGAQNLLESINRGLPYLQLLSGLKNGDPVSIIAGGAQVGVQLGLWNAIPGLNIVLAIYSIGKALLDIFSDSDAEALVQAASTRDGKTVTAQLLDNNDGGERPALAMYDDLIKGLSDSLKDRPDMGLIAARLPKLSFYAIDAKTTQQGFFTLISQDNNGQEQRIQYHYDGSVAPTGGDALALAPEFFQNISQNFARLAEQSGAIAPSWIIQTIDAQVARSVPIPIFEDRPRYGAEGDIVGTDRVQVGSTLPANADPYAGLSTEQRAAAQGQLLATDPGDATANNAGGNTAASQQSVRPIVLDLDGNGIQLTRRAQAGGVLLDVDDDGFAEQTDWIGAKEGILVADLDGDGQIRGGHEMFNDSQVDMSQRGLEVLREYDANGDGTITAADAALNHLKIWQDVNHDGIAQSHELSTLAQNNITELNYTTGEFTQNATQKTLALADLVASSAGVVSQQVGNNVLLTREEGAGASATQLLASALLNLNEPLASLEPEPLEVDDILPTGQTEFYGSLVYTISDEWLYGQVVQNSQGIELLGFAVAASQGSTVIGQREGEVYIGTIPEQALGNYYDDLDALAAITDTDYPITDWKPILEEAVTYVNTSVDGTLRVANEVADGLEDQTLTIAISQLLANDASTATNANLIIEEVGVPAHGQVVLDAANGVVRFTPDANYHGEASFVYRVRDTASGQVANAKALIAVKSVNDLPQMSVAYGLQAVGVEDVMPLVQQYDYYGNFNLDAFNIAMQQWELGELVTDTQGIVTLGHRSDGSPDNPTLLVGLREGRAYISEGEITVRYDRDDNRIYSAAAWRPLGKVDYTRGKVSVADADRIEAVQVQEADILPFASNDDYGDPGVFALSDSWLQGAEELNTQGITKIGQVGSNPYNPESLIGVRGGKIYISTELSNDYNSGGFKADGWKPLLRSAAVDGLGDYKFELLNTTQFGQLSGLPAGTLDWQKTGEWSYRVDDESRALGGADDAFEVSVKDAAGGQSMLRVIVKNPEPIRAADQERGDRYEGPGYSEPEPPSPPDPRDFDFDIDTPDAPPDPDPALNSPPSPDPVAEPLGTDESAEQNDEGDDDGESTSSDDGDDGESTNEPIVLDLGRDGFRFVRPQDSTAFYDFNDDGQRELTGWVTGGDGILAYDKNGDGTISGRGEIVLKDYVAGASTDLQGLRFFDSNNDGQFSAADEKWRSFYVWRDENVNGLQEDGELLGLGTLGIRDISLASTVKNDRVSGNTVFGLGQFHWIDGTQGQLADAGFGKAAELYSETPNDDITAAAAGGLISSGTGDDLIRGGLGQDQVSAGAGKDVVVGGGGNDEVYGDAGDDSIAGDAGNDRLFGGLGSDLLQGGEGADLLRGQEGSDVLWGEAGDDRLFGDAGNDYLYGGLGSDDVFGGAGRDVLVGGEGDDQLDGGDGVDQMVGGIGNDTYYRGNQFDTVVELAGEGSDTLVSAVDVANAFNHLENIVLSGTQALTATADGLNNALYGNQGNNTLDGGLGADKMDGGAGDDTYIVDNAGDTIFERADGITLAQAGAAGSSQLTAEHSLPGNFFNAIGHTGFAGNRWGTDTVQASISYALGDNLEHLTLTGYRAIDATGNSAANILTGNSAANTLTGGAGDDRLLGGTGDDRYVYARGDGSDTIIDAQGQNRLVFGAGITAEDLRFSLQGKDLVIRIAQFGDLTEDQIVLSHWHLPVEQRAGAQRVSSMQFADGSVVVLNEAVLNPVVRPREDTAQLSEDAASVGGNVFVNDSGLNLRVTSAGNYEGTYGTLTLATDGQYSYALRSAAQAVQGLRQGQSLTESFSYGVTVVATPETTTATSNLTLTITGSNDAPVVQADTAAVTEGSATTASGNVLSNDSDVDAGTVLTLANAGIYQGTYGQLTLAANGDYSYALNNSAANVQNLAAGQQVTDVFAVQTTDGTATVASNLTLSITGANTNANPVLAGAISDQIATEIVAFELALPAGTFTDTDAGQTLSYSATLTNGDPLPAWLSFNAATQTFSGEPAFEDIGNLAVTITATDTQGASATADFNLTVNQSPELTVRGTAGEDSLRGASRNDMIDGAAGADAMRGGRGDDRYVVDNTADLVNEFFNQGNDSIYSSINYVTPAHVENIFLTGSTAITATGNELNNVLIGNAGNNHLVGGAGDDLLAGWLGSDSLDGGQGADMYLWNQGDGRDTITESSTHSGMDRLRFGAGITLDSLVSREFTDASGQRRVFISVLDADGQERADQGVELALTAGNTVIERFELADGSTFSLGQIKVNTTSINGGNGNDTLTGSHADDRINGSNGNDTLFGRSGNDTLWGDNGNDKLFGEGGDDKLWGGNGDDSLQGGAGNDELGGDNGKDTLIAGSGDDKLYGGNDADTLDAGSGNDVLIGDNGEDQLFAGDGDDKLYGGNDYDLLAAGAGNDLIESDNGVDLIVAGAGNDNITSGNDGDFVDAGSGNDVIDTSNGVDFIAGGKGNDQINTGHDNDVIAFNRGDGQDTLAAGDWQQDTLSLGGIRYSEISLKKSGNHLILDLGQGDQITLSDWYASSSNQKKGIKTLQVVTEGADYNATSSDRLYKNKVVTLDMLKLATAFDQARAAAGSSSALNTGAASWAITTNTNAALNTSYLSSSNTQAIGGDLAWRYATLNTGSNAAVQGTGSEASYGNLDAAAVRTRMNGVGNWQNLSSNASASQSGFVNPWIALQAGISLIVEQPTGANPTITPVQALTQDQLIGQALGTQQQLTAVARPSWV